MNYVLEFFNSYEFHTHFEGLINEVFISYIYIYIYIVFNFSILIMELALSLDDDHHGI